ncbi:dihydrodipicolinate synthase family protein [Blastopirellula sp. JC732]|uniref:Dihydrodipicolinate synthase family protein n=1 Tax=Blastopirellula sediminis TaxID=2894196 RepID=A0A9X1MT80_9BACT|nr:dihydrodipicolinate synthase family protein [Blastopirellula sediminis]MCC9605541.1 dihydrodipicolinate synthase family protein [Blastopirellula sediminis]MCC9631159.1 dihydrodipicolinate synthase family protein [Blastopirellula sediminis]
MNRYQGSLSGVLPVFQTPYLENGEIDYATLKREIDWLLECGSDGVVMAMVSEVLRLTTAESRQLSLRVCEIVDGRGAVVISVGGESNKIAIENAQHAESVGATAVMAIPPVSIGAMEVELVAYYEAIVNAISLPVVVQDASGYVGKPMSIDMQADLLHRFGAERIFFKPEATPIGPRLSALRDATDGQARIFEGTGGIALVDSYRRGIVGTMPGADLIRGIVALYQALQAGNERRVYELSLPISAIVAAQHSLDAFLAIEKYLLVKQGIFQNTIVRGPRAYRLDRETVAEIDRLYQLLCDVLEKP